jgi:23S rRNA maturation mini-RNase III
MQTQKEPETATDYLLKKLKKWDSNKPMTVKAVRAATQNKTNFNFADTLDELESQGLIQIEKRGKNEIIILM